MSDTPNDVPAPPASEVRIPQSSLPSAFDVADAMLRLRLALEDLYFAAVDYARRTGAPKAEEIRIAGPYVYALERVRMLEQAASQGHIPFRAE